MSRPSALAHIAIWSRPNEPITSGTTLKPALSTSWRSGYSICAECSAAWTRSLRATGARSARRSSHSRSTGIVPSGVDTASDSGATSRFSIHARWLGASTTTRRNPASRTSLTARHAISPEYAQPAWGRRSTFGLAGTFASPVAFSPPTRFSHSSASARISRSFPGYHDPAIVLSSGISYPISENIRLIPFRASERSASSDSSVNGLCSAVPCSST